jgi:hypothetical protein
LTAKSKIVHEEFLILRANSSVLPAYRMKKAVNRPGFPPLPSAFDHPDKLIAGNPLPFS